MSIRISTAVKEALANKQPVIALETAVLTSGLPQKPWSDDFGDAPEWLEKDIPINLAIAKDLTSTVIESGVVPAWVCVMNGEFVIGASLQELEELTLNKLASKITNANIAHAMRQGASAGTTGATTLLACKHPLLPSPIRTFATGGIGGIHTNWSIRLDISADLVALATTQTCVVASGAKSILDIPATMEALEPLGVPIVGFETKTFPRFIESSEKKQIEIKEYHSYTELINLCRYHWNTLNLQSAVLVAVPVQPEFDLLEGTLEPLIKEAEIEWSKGSLKSPERTPFLLDYIVKATQGKSLIANLMLLKKNVKIATGIANYLANDDTA